MPIPIPQPDVFSITPILAAHQAGTQMRHVQEDRNTAAEERLTQAISQMAYRADTPQEWSTMLGALQRRFPDADLSQFADFSTRDMAIGAGLSVPDQFNMDMTNRAWDQSQGDRARADAEAAALRTGLTGLVDGQMAPTTDGGRSNGSWMLAGAGSDQAPQMYRDAIASIESEGSGDYQAVGPVANESGDRAYGRYQIMGANVGPWTEQVLGRRMTPQEFLASPEAQDAVFDGIFGGYVRQYGPQGAAQAWFGGPGSVGSGGAGTDVLGTSGNEYVDRFSRAIGMAPQGGVPLSDQQRSLVHALIDGGQMDAALQIITAAMQPPEPPSYGFTEVNGTLVRTDERGGTAVPMLTVPEAPGEAYGPVVTGPDAAVFNLDPTRRWQQRRDTGEWDEVGGGGQTINVGQGEVGTIPPGYELFTDPDTGARSLRLIPGGPAATEAEAEDAAAAARRGQELVGANVVLQDIDTALGAAGTWTTGFIGNLAQVVPGTPAADLARTLESIRANVGFGALQQMREASPTGGALGPVSDTENRLLQSTLGSLAQSQSEAQFRANLERLRTIYLDIVHGQGNWRLDNGEVVLNRMGTAMQNPNPTPAAPNLSAPAGAAPAVAPVAPPTQPRPVAPASSTFQTLMQRAAEREGVTPVEGQTATVDGRPYVFHDGAWWVAQ